MTSKPLLYSALQPERITFGEPVRDNKGMSIPVQYDGKRLQFQLPRLKVRIRVRIRVSFRGPRKRLPARPLRAGFTRPNSHS